MLNVANSLYQETRPPHALAGYVRDAANQSLLHSQAESVTAVPATTEPAKPTNPPKPAAAPAKPNDKAAAPAAEEGGEAAPKQT